MQYRVNDAVNVYAYGAKSFFPNGRNRQLRYNFLTGYATPAPLPAYFWGIPSERFGAMAEFKLGKNAMIQVSVEHQNIENGRETSDEGALMSYIRGRLLFKPPPSTKAPRPSENRLL